ncbi:MAG: Crp/Fnr family transcriptional regulator [Pseudomonadota bacterium]
MIRNELTFPKGSFLHEISDESWQLLSHRWSSRPYKSGQFLISAESGNKDVFFVLRGAAKATIYTPTGREVSFVDLSIGSIFGEFSAIDDAPRSASVVAMGECLAARMSPEEFRDILRTYPDISFNLMVLMVSSLRSLSKRVVDFNAKSADHRLREALVALAERHSRGSDQAKVERPPTQTELASYIFASREGVAREMGRLRKQGLLDRDRRSLVIPSISALRESLTEFES